MKNNLKYLDNSENANKNDTLYLSLYIRSNFLSKEHKRTVKKIDEYLGYSGGIWSFFSLFFGFLTRKYNERKLMIKIRKRPKKFFLKHKIHLSFSGG